MKGWTKIASFDRIHQAELRKDILEKNDVQAVVINERDSSFLLGEIELYVEDVNVEKAEFLLGEFIGWEKIEAFIREHQIARLKDVLEKNNIETYLLEREEPSYHIPEYELYVKKHDYEEAKSLMNHLEGWSKIDSFLNIIQSTFRVDKLEENSINTIIMNQRDENFNIMEVHLYVENQNIEKAKSLIGNFEGWAKVESYNSLTDAELNIHVVEDEFIEVIEFLNKDSEGKLVSVDLYVKENEIQKAKEIIDAHQEWVVIKSVVNLYEANLYRDILEENYIYANIISEKDNSFLLGEINVYVLAEKKEKAESILNDYENSNKQLLESPDEIYDDGEDLEEFSDDLEEELEETEESKENQE